MEAIACLDRHNKLSQHQKCGLNICCYTRKLTMNRGNERVFIFKLGSQTDVLTIVSHSPRYGEWSCQECKNDPYAACTFQYCDTCWPSSFRLHSPSFNYNSFIPLVSSHCPSPHFLTDLPILNKVFSHSPSPNHIFSWLVYQYDDMSLRSHNTEKSLYELWKAKFILCL